SLPTLSSRFFFTPTPPTQLYTLSLHDALPICPLHGVEPARCESERTDERGSCGGDVRGARPVSRVRRALSDWPAPRAPRAAAAVDRKSTRLNSSHVSISYAVFCLKKKKKMQRT